MIDSKMAEELVPADYRIDADALLTPALVIYPDTVRHNVDTMLKLLDGNPARWRPHLKTAKLASVVQLLVEKRITTAKCATTLELLVACQCGMRDALVAYSHSGRNARRVAEIAAEFPAVQISAMVESTEQISNWHGTRVGLFIDVNSGMDRTGLPLSEVKGIAKVAETIEAAGLVFRGIHFYDGHATEIDLAERASKAHARYDELLRLLSELHSQGIAVGEVITSGTPALPAALSHSELWNGAFTCQVSPGTVVYNDASSLGQLPREYGFRAAALVITRVVSHPKPNVVTCDAGHKALSVDSGVPNSLVIGHPDLTPLKPSEEHLPLGVSGPARVPAIGEALYLLPRHVCPTVNNFDWAVMAEDGKVLGLEPVSARGREPALSAAYVTDSRQGYPQALREEPLRPESGIETSVGGGT